MSQAVHDAFKIQMGYVDSAVASVTGIGGMAGALGGVLLVAAAGLIRVRYGNFPLFVIASSSYLVSC